jgi:hypothetical protein
MNLDDAVQTVAKKGFTERQARFLVLVARHSGVCVMRQYAAFAGIVFGQKTRKFFAKLESLGWVSTYDCAHNRARIYHLRHRDLYAAIGEPESRLRRPPAVPRALERLMVLDTILEHPDIVWLATPEEKVAHLTTLTRVALEDLPHLVIGQGDARQVRYFPDRLPIGIHPESRVVLVYLVVDPWRDEFRAFLQRHAAMLAGLSAWTVRVGLPAHMAGLAERMQKNARAQIAAPLRDMIRDELRWYFERLRAGRSDGQTAADAERFQRAQRAFQGPRYPLLYRAWLHDAERVLTVASSRTISDALDAGVGRIEPRVLPHSYGHLSPLVGVA